MLYFTASGSENQSCQQQIHIMAITASNGELTVEKGAKGYQVRAHARAIPRTRSRAGAAAGRH